MPHAHICLFLSSSCKFPTAKDVDRVISAEIPDKEKDPELYELVEQFMIHGPCGVDNPRCPCMIQGKCSKKFPKKFVDSTSLDSDGYPLYMRRDTGHTVQKNGVTLHNGFVVPYNARLLRKFQSHINVEWCNQSGAIKYLFKYINKGPDRVTATVYQVNGEKNDQQVKQNEDEIKAYFDCRYISACEAAWRIFSYDIHYRFPAVLVLPFHLEDEQSIVFDENDNLCDVVDSPTVARSMFNEWMECNKKDPFARNLNYVDFPKYYVWLRQKRQWCRRQQRGSIGRIHYVPPSLGECYYLRIILNKVKGPTCFADIRTVNGKVYSTYKEACYALGLLDDDKEYVDGIVEASSWATGAYLRKFFAMLLLSSTLSRPDFVWSQTWSLLCEDILYKQQKINNLPGNILHCI